MNNPKTASKKKLLTLSILATLLPGGMLLAADAPSPAPVYSFDEVVVTATRTENDVKDVPASTQIITQDDIKQSGATNVRNAITDFANITMTRKIRGGGHEIIIRGMSTDKSLIMINGHRVANEADGSGLGNANALDRINLNNVEKIEIVKGPSSALYGSEAMGGVINIITKGSKEAEVRTGLINSSDDFTNWWHFDSGEIGKFSATLDMRFNKERTKLSSDGVWTNNHGTAQTYNFDAKYRFNDHNYLDFYVDAFSQNQTKEGNGSEFTSVDSRMAQMMWGMKGQTGRAPTMAGYKITTGDGGNSYNQKTYGLSWNGHTNRNDWQIQTYLSKFKWKDYTHAVNTSNAIIPAGYTGKQIEIIQKILSTFNSDGSNYDFNNNTNDLWAVEARDTIRLNNANRVTFGMEYTKNKVTGTNLGDAANDVGSMTEGGVTKKTSEKEISTYAAYLQDEITTGKWYIVPAIRYDHHSMFGNHTSPKLGVTYKVDDTFRFKANYGKGFKAPTIPQLYYNFTRMMGRNPVTLLGNPDLKPETSTSWDIGVEKEWNRMSTSLVYFNTSVDDMIEYQQIYKDSKKTISKTQNIEEAKIKGVEHTLGIKFNDMWNFKVNSTWLINPKKLGENADKTGKVWSELAQRSKLSQVYALSFDDGKDTGWSAMLWDVLNYKYAVPVTETMGNKIVAGPRKTFNTLNFTLTRKVNADTRVYGSVQNIFDKEDTDCDLDGRYWSLGWEHKF